MEVLFSTEVLFGFFDHLWREVNPIKFAFIVD